MAAKPKISVLLPVYNAARFLPEALASMADQTCRDFEVVAVDDGATDSSGQILEDFARTHAWLTVIHQANAGIAVALNQAFAASRGEFIARMDADDVAAPERLARQADYLRMHPTIGVVGAWARTFGDGGSAMIKAPVTDDAIRSWLIFGSAFVHPTVMMRREVLAKLAGPYVADAPPVEDYALWLALSGLTQFHNLPEVLLNYRCHTGQVTVRKPAPSGEKLMRLRLALLSRLGLDCSAAEQQVLGMIGFEVVGRDRPSSPEVAAWLEKLCAVVPATGWCSAAALRADCGEAWWRFHCGGKGGWAGAWEYGKASVAGRTPRTMFRMARLARR